MALSAHTTPSGFQLPSIHSAPPFFTQQPNPQTNAVQTEHWTRLILIYARHRRLFILRVDDTEITSDWDEVLRNERINRRMTPTHLSDLLATMVARGVAAYEPAKQTRAVLLFWRTPDEWAELLHSWASSTGQLNTILTFYDITDPPTPSDLSGLPVPLLRKAIAILARSARAQSIAIADGEGVRFFEGKGT